MPESVKEDILNEGARRAVHTTYKNLRLGLIAACMAMLALTVGNVVAWGFVFRDAKVECLDRQERVEAHRRVWNAVFDEIERQNPKADAGLDKLQEVVDNELQPVNC